MRRILVAAKSQPEVWAELFRQELPGHAVLTTAPETGEVAYVVVGKPDPGLISSLPGLEVVLSLNAGVEHLLASGEAGDHVPIVRMVDPGLVEGMVEWVAAQVLAWHRNLFAYRDQQHEGVWRQRPEKLARERTVAVLGAGALGGPVAGMLRTLGFRLRVWSRTARDVPGMTSYAGPQRFGDCLAGADVLVNLLPSTAQTRDLLDAAAFRRLAPGALLVNAGRAASVVDADLLAALDSGQLAAAALDVFREEPLPPEHPFWRHPRVLVSPHVAAPTHARTAVAVMAETVRRHERGEPLVNLVDRARGY